MNKKLICNSQIISLCALFAIFSVSPEATAQARRPAAAPSAAKKEIALKKVEMLKFKTPDFRAGNSTETAVNPADWTMVRVQFDTEADWTDRLEVKYYIVVKHPKTAAYTMFTGSYVYSDIPRGRGHQAAVFLRPRTLERYGAAERAAVEIISKGEMVAMGGFPEASQPWWRTATVRSVEGYVIERSQTPFALIAADSYLIPAGK